jgi:hypothetical protein
MKNAGYAHMGVGQAKGEDKARLAATMAISSPLLSTSIAGATGVLISITASPDIQLSEIDVASRMVQEEAHPDANIIWGTSFNEDMTNEIRITIIATGFVNKHETLAEAKASQPVKVAPPVAEQSFIAPTPAIEEKKEVFFTASESTYVPSSEPVTVPATSTIVEEQSFQPIMKAKPVFASRVGTTEVDIKVSVEEEPYNNWIVYRLSDVLLNNAEARACLVKLGVDKAENKKVCSQILRMINRRWWVDVVNGGDVSNDVSVAQKYDIDFTTNTDESYLKHVMDTRKIELIGEGKRWFDLVRYTERLSAADDSEDAMRTMFNEYMSAITGYEMARNRCENLWGLYSPIYYMECKAYRAGGYNINQNPVWNKSKYDR